MNNSASDETIFQEGVLKALGLGPEQLGPEKMELLKKLASKISDPEKMTAGESSQLFRDLGRAMGNQKPRPKFKVRVKRNDPCLCGSGRKSKHCCASNT